VSATAGNTGNLPEFEMPPLITGNSWNFVDVPGKFL